MDKYNLKIRRLPLGRDVIDSYDGSIIHSTPFYELVIHPHNEEFPEDTEEMADSDLKQILKEAINIKKN